MKNPIAIVDCATTTPAYHCFNRLVKTFQKPFSYHLAPLQKTLSLRAEGEASAYIILGSDSNVEDRLPWQIELAEFIKAKIEKKVPVFALCFGHQLMADAFGCKVGKIKTPYLEGFRQMQMTQSVLGIEEGVKLNFIKAHGYEVTDLTDDFYRFGTSEECLNDGLGLKNYPYWSVQCHPEASSFFIQNEVDLPLSDGEKEATYRDGFQLIGNFLKEVEKY